MAKEPRWKQHIGRSVGLQWEDTPEYEVVYGHVSAEDLSRETDYDGDAIEQVWGRWGVTLGEDGPRQNFDQHDRPGPGRFPVTLGWLGGWRPKGWAPLTRDPQPEAAPQ